MDKGYVKLIDVMGSDLSVVNAARASFNKDSQSLTEKDKGLIDFLVKNKHDSVFRHSAMTFEVYAPMEVKNQLIKHLVGSTHMDDQFGWNEISRRYVTSEPEYFAPDAWRSAPENRKQGSGPNITDPETLDLIDDLYTDYIEYADNLYYRLMDLGVAPEQARLVLPGYAVYTRWRWTASLAAVLNFLSLRLKEDAQYEIRQYAKEVESFVRANFGYTYESWMKWRVNT